MAVKVLKTLVVNGREVFVERFMMSYKCGLLKDEVRRVVREIVLGHYQSSRFTGWLLGK
jgi:hypothetical protein